MDLKHLLPPQEGIYVLLYVIGNAVCHLIDTNLSEQGSGTTIIEQGRRKFSENQYQAYDIFSQIIQKSQTCWAIHGLGMHGSCRVMKKHFNLIKGLNCPSFYQIQKDQKRKRVALGRNS